LDFFKILVTFILWGRQARPDHYMRPDYSHKIFGDKRLHRFFFQKALARAIASA
jgi:hypothetical protein